MAKAIGAIILGGIVIKGVIGYSPSPLLIPSLKRGLGACMRCGNHTAASYIALNAPPL